MRKILIIIFGILLLVIGIEVAVYLLHSQSGQMEAKKQTIGMVTPSQNSGISPTPVDVSKSEADVALSELNSTRIGLTKGALASANLDLQYKGTISKLEYGTHTLSNGLVYEVLLEIRYSENRLGGLVFSKQDLSHLQVFRRDKNGDTQAINLQDLKQGDQITFAESIDLSKPVNDNIIKGVITKID